MFLKKKEHACLEEQTALLQALKTQKEKYAALTEQYTHALGTLKAKQKEADEILMELKKLRVTNQT